MSGSLVLELQRFAQGNTPLPELMRYAKTVAVKLGLRDTQTWIEHELAGYPGEVELPAYRIIACELRASNRFQPWQTLRWSESNELEEILRSWYVRFSISHVESLAGGQGEIHASISQGEMDVLMRFFGERLAYFQIARFFSRASFVTILQSVRNKVLDWSLALEQKGVLGNGMTFEDKERRQATGVVLNVSRVGTLIQGDYANAPSANHSPGASVALASALDSPGSTINALTGSLDQRIRYALERLHGRDSTVADTAQKLSAAIRADPVLRDDQKEESMEALMCLLEESAKPAEQRQPKGALKALANGLRETLGVSADLAQLASVFYPPILALLAISS